MNKDANAHTKFIIRHPLKKETQLDVGLLLEGLYDLNSTTDFNDTYKIIDEMIEFFSLEMKFVDPSELDFDTYQDKLYCLYSLRRLFRKVA